MAVSQLLAGAILVGGNQALLLNGVESYGRYPSTDAHFEKVLFAFIDLATIIT